MSELVRVVVVGAGAIAQVAHLPALRRLQGVEVAAICDNDSSKAHALAARFQVPDAYDDIEEVLRYARADAALICTPNHLHEIHVVAALSAGLHVLCERPLALSAAGVERVLKASERYGKRVIVGMNHRFRSDVQAVRSFLAGGDLGLWLAGWPAPKRVSAHVLRPAGPDSVEEMGSALVVCETGLLLSVDVSWRHLGEGERFWFDLVGSKGSAAIQPLRIIKDVHGVPTDVTPTGAISRETQFAQSYRAEWTYFLAVIKGDVNAPPPRDQLLLQQVVDAVYRSADEGRDVIL